MHHLPSQLFEKMPGRIRQFFGFAIITMIWWFMWYGPWQTILEHYIWVRLGIGLMIFIIPGLCIYGLLVEDSGAFLDHFSFGFVISHLMFAVLGTLGRLTHLSFGTIKLVMAVLGLVFLLLFLSRISPHKIGLKSIVAARKRGLPVVLLLLVALASCMLVIQRVITDDDLTYLAYLNDWQNSSQLDFKDVIFGRPDTVHPRFWIMSTPFAQALLADLGRVPGILILSGYYEPFLVILAVMSWYGLYRALSLSSRAASVSAILQLSFLLLLSEYLHPGAPFYNQLSADKSTAAFILAPVFVQSLIRLLEKPLGKNTLLLLLSGLSLTFMHPIILAYSVFIAGMMVVFDRRNIGIRRKLIPLIVLIMIMIPQMALRYVSSRTSIAIPFDAGEVVDQGGIGNLITRWNDTPFYGLDLDTLSMNIPYGENLPLPEPVRKWGWVLLPVLAGYFAVRHFGEDYISQFILSCLLLCLLVIIPLTGWVVGFFLSAWMLERAGWLFPFGLSTVYIFLNVRKKLNASSSLNRAMGSGWTPVLIAFLSVGLLFLHMRGKDLPDIEKFTARSQRYQDLAIAGRELDDRIVDHATVIGSPNFNDLIPGLSWKSELVTFRISDPNNMSYFSPEHRDDRISDSRRLFSRSASVEEKMSILEKYDVDFLFLQPFDRRLFTGLLESYPDRMETSEVGGVVLVEISH